MTKILKHQFFFGVIFSIMATAVFADHKEKEYEYVQYLWLLDGLKNTYECDVPETEIGSTIANCHDHKVIDLKTNKIIGIATDATTDVETVGDGLVATGTTFFHLPEGNLVIRGRGTIQPMLEGEPKLNGAPVTHIAGIFPEDGENNVIDGTGVFRNATGTFGLLGALDLTNAAEGQAQFNCVYFLNLRLEKNVDCKPKNKRNRRSKK